MNTRVGVAIKANLPVLGLNCGLRSKGEEGNAITELALLLPIFVALVVGIGAFGVYVVNRMTLIHATDEGARYLQEIRPTLTSTSDPCGAIFGAITNAAPSLKSSSIGVTISVNGGTTNGTDREQATACSGASAFISKLQAGQGLPVTITTTYPCSVSVLTGSADNFTKQSFPSLCPMSTSVTEYLY